jgi:hypothetical protein
MARLRSMDAPQQASRLRTGSNKNKWTEGFANEGEKIEGPWQLFGRGDEFCTTSPNEFEDDAM